MSTEGDGFREPDGDITAALGEALAAPATDSIPVGALVREAREDIVATLGEALATVPDRPRIACLCGSTRFYDQFQQANYDLTMRGEIVLSVGFYPHAKTEHGHGEGVGHDSAEKTALDQLHKRKIDLADRVLVVSDATGYFGASTRSEVEYAIAHGKPVEFAEPAAEKRARETGLIR